MERPTNITTAARRLTIQHNNSERVMPGNVYEVILDTGDIDGLVSNYYAEQYKPGHPKYGKVALMRIRHRRIRQYEAQQFIDNKGEGW